MASIDTVARGKSHMVRRRGVRWTNRVRDVMTERILSGHHGLTFELDVSDVGSAGKWQRRD